MKTTPLLVAACVLLSSTLVGRAGPSSPPSPAAGSHSQLDCGGEPCDAVLRGLLAFFDRSPDGLAGNGRSCADCHMVTDSFQLSPASVEARFQFLQWRRRLNPRPTIRCSGRSTPTTSGPTASSASDFSNLRQNGLVRITFPLPANIRLIDPVTNAPSDETFVDVWRSVPTVNDVKLTGPDGSTRGRAGRTATGGYQLDARVRDAPGAGAGRADQPRAGPRIAPPQQLLDDLHPSSACCSRTTACARCPTPSTRARRRCPIPIRRSPRSSSRARSSSCARARSATVARASRRRSRRSSGIHDIFAQCPRPVDTVARRRASPSRRARRGSPATRGPTRSRWRTGPRSAAPARIPGARC